MFVPSIYRNRGSERLRAVVEGYPLAVLVSNGEDVPLATHLPIVANGSDPGVPLDGTILLGHMNRANPHWHQLVAGVRAKLVFSGPHGYVTPALYRRTPAAPTWNFVAVHVSGTVQPVADFEETLAVVERTARVLETRFGDGWAVESSLGYFRELAPKVGAFRFLVESAVGMFKLSQEQTDDVRARISKSMSTAGGCAGALGPLMRDFEPDHEPITDRE